MSTQDDTDEFIRIQNMATDIASLREEVSLAREALQTCDNFLDYSHAGTGNQELAYRYVKRLIKEWLSR